MPLQIEQHKEQRCLVIVVRGSFGAVEDAKCVRVAVSDALARGQTLILINLAEAGDLDNFGAETLLACSFMTSHRGGLLQIFGARRASEALLAGSGTGTLLSSARSEEEAETELLDTAARKGIDYKPFDILEFVRQEEKHDGSGGFESQQPKPSEA